MTSDQNPGFKDRRGHRRVTDSFTILYKVRSPFDVRMRYAERELDGIARDLSVGGVGIYSNEEIPAAAELGLKFNIMNEVSSNPENRYRSFDINGQVCYCLLTEEKSYRLGVLFRGLDKAGKEFIANYIQAQALEPSKYDT